MTKEVYSEVPSAKIRSALKRLGRKFDDELMTTSVCCTSLLSGDPKGPIR
jgi:hypothetical protein